MNIDGSSAASSLIISIFRVTKEEYQCYANEPRCIRLAVNDLSKRERILLDEFFKNDNLTEIVKFIENKLSHNPETLREFYQWQAKNVVPEALKEIITSLTQAQKR